jgi:hypothetical protein
LAFPKADGMQMVGLLFDDSRHSIIWSNQIEGIYLFSILRETLEKILSKITPFLFPFSPSDWD